MTRGWNAKRALSRRTVLRGMAHGAAITVGLPTLPSMLNTNGTAYAQSGQPIKKYFGLFTWSHGAQTPLWIPEKVGRGDQWAPSEELKPLASFKDYLSVVTGTKRPGQGHMSGPAAMLTGSPMVQTNYPEGGNPRGISARASIDQDVAAAWPGSDGKPQKVLVAGVCPGSGNSEGPICQSTSFRGFNDPVPPLYDPLKVFGEIFGASFAPPAPSGSKEDPRRALRPSVLDVVKRDLDSLKREVGASDRARLDEHFEDIRAIEESLKAPPVLLTCDKPAAPPSLANLDGQENATTNGDLNTRISKHMADLVALALACGRTRVFNLAWSRDTGGPSLTWLGTAIDNRSGQPFKFQGHHGMSHDERRAVVVPGMPAVMPMMHKGVVLAMESLGYLLEALRKRTDGAGNLLDASALLCMSDMISGGHGGHEIPILLAGKAGGKLKGNVHVNFRNPPTPLLPNAGSFHPSDCYSWYSTGILRVHVTALRALGLDVPGYGVKPGFTLAPGLLQPTYRFRHAGTETFATVVEQNFHETEPFSELLA